MTLKSVKSIPQGYGLFRTLDIRDRKSLVMVNIWGIILLVGAWLGFSKLAQWLRPEINSNGSLFRIIGIQGGLILVASLLVVTVVMLFVHEGLHGICFWVFTKSRPMFAFKIYYAYAAAPGWFIPKPQYLVTALAPLMGITLLSVAGIAWLDASLINAFIWLLILNTSGSVGDLWVVAVLLHSPTSVYVQDLGDRVEIFTPTNLTPNPLL